MSTSLQQQLEQLSGRQPKHQYSTLTNNPSFIYNFEVAKELSIDEIYNIGYNGLMELIKIDGTFEKFRENLFSENFKKIDRDFEDKSFNEELDNNIGSFLRRLSPYFILRASHKALEWIIRRFRIWKLNLDSIMECIIPYHETNLFVRMIQMCHIHETKWQFLMMVGKSGTPLSRLALSKQCINDTSVLSFIAKSLEQHVNENPTNHGTFVSFYTALLIEIFRDNIKDELLRIILPNLFNGLLSNSLDLRVN